jgi:hypothetical protein
VQLDKTGIVIRERDWLETLDLALQVIRRHGPQLLAALAAGALPAAALNYLLLGGFLDPQDLQEDTPVGYCFLELLLMVVELPVATAFVTLYLGGAMFMRRRTPRELLGEFVGSLPQLAWFTLLLRAPVFVGWLVAYCGWPYLNEVILLERNPLFGRKDRVATFRRASDLHSGFQGEFLGGALGGLIVTAGLIVSLTWSLWNLRGTLTGDWRLDWALYAFVAPCVAWLVAGYFAVVRFLGYLNLRIRREGWEVELRLRAERARLTAEAI